MADPTTADTDPDARAQPAWVGTLLAAINVARARQMLPPLAHDSRLTKGAGFQVDWITGGASPAILGMGGVFLGWEERLAEAGCPAGAVCGMSIVAGAASSQGVVNNILGIPAYSADLKAMMSSEFAAVGFGNGMDSEKVHWWVVAYQTPYKV